MIRVCYRDKVEFNIANDDERGLYFVLGVRKSGSSIFNSIIGALADMNSLRYVDVAGTLFKSGLRVSDWQRDTELRNLLRPGNVFGGFRNYPIGLAGDPRFAESPKILMVRDPRDALVSEYFSNAYSHSIPQSGQGRSAMLAQRETALNSDLQAYVLKMAPSMRQTLHDYRVLLDHPSARLIRYEDAIIRKRTMIKEICSYFSWSVSEQQTHDIMGWADVIPETERPTEFIRRVLPQDYLEKLAPATIGRLNTIMADEMAVFGYN
jgi:hypothetical protein